MLNEKEDVRAILRGMTKSSDGRSCIVACLISIAMAAMNLLIPDLFIAGNINRTEKWLAIWLAFPLLSFLIYLRSQQIFDGSGSMWLLVRSIFVLFPVFVLIYFNIFKG